MNSQTITYSSLFYSSTNVNGADLDVSTGLFTAGWAGTYTVTWSGSATVDGHDLYIFLQKNGEDIEDSRTHSYIGGGFSDIVDQGGRTLVLYLDRGDTLSLFCDDCSDGIGHVTFCVSLSNFDI